MRAASSTRLLVLVQTDLRPYACEQRLTPQKVRLGLVETRSQIQRGLIAVFSWGRLCWCSYWLVGNTGNINIDVTPLQEGRFHRDSKVNVAPDTEYSFMIDV